ncbi:MAG: electron transfer flavoprotein subunit alpha/FixB family protein [Actinomycetota bacterium]
MTMLVVIEHDRGALAEAGREALTAARDLAERLDLEVHAVVLGQSGADLADELGAHGASTVHVADHDLLADYGPDAWAETVRQLADELDAEVVLSVGTDRGNEVLANLAARTDLPFVANCTTIDAEDDDQWSMTRVQWGGSLLEDATLSADRKLVTFAHHAVVAETTDDGDAEVVAFEPDLDPDDDPTLATTVIVDRMVMTQGVTLSTAPVVVSGGRGVGSADGFGPLEELAELLDGRVGCSRAVTNNGWRPHADQVGQTGTRIVPEIYIATGISGAIQHWVGAMASKKILALNTDPEANMVTKADYAVIADLHEVVPAISAEIRRRRGA